MSAKMCTVEDNGEPCGKPHRARGCCNLHYQQESRRSDTRTCAITENGARCGKPAGARGWCGMHYQRWRHHGDALWTPPLVSLSEKFWSHVDRDGPIHPVLKTSCWLWTAGRCNGYGLLHDGDRQLYAHRYSLESAMGMLWPQYQHLHIDHRCHNQLCVRPTHLRVATSKQNSENLRGPHRDSTSGVLGVDWDKRKGRWHGRVGHNRKTFHVGYFASLEDAEAAVIAKRLELFTHNDLDRLVMA